MKRVLILDQRFPSTGGTRTEKFVKFLPEFNWDPIVLTVDQSQKNPFYQEILNTYDRNGFKLFTTGTIPDFSFLNKLKMERFAGALNSLLFIPDVTSLWLPFAVVKGCKIIEKEKPDIIYSTSPSEGVHLIAYLLKKISKVPWVSDFRDLWTLYKCRYRPVTTLHNKINRYLEKMIYRNWSDFIIINTPLHKDSIVKNFDAPTNKLKIIPNGFDYDDVKKNVTIKKNGNKLVLGIFGAVEKPSSCFNEFLEGYREALKEEKGFSLILWSKISEQLRTKISGDQSLKNHIIISDYASHQKGMEKLAQVDILVALLAEGFGWTVPQKIYNYLAIEKPIFAVVPPNGSAAEVIKKTKSGIIVDSSETKKISEKLIEVHKMWKMNQLSIQSDKIAIQEYERRHGTRQLVDIFNRISD